MGIRVSQNASTRVGTSNNIEVKVMKISVPREIKNNEFRVAMTPAGVRDLTQAGHQVMVETGAGVGSGISDAEYVEQGATIVADAATAWNSADMVVKVKGAHRIRIRLFPR